MKTFTTAFLLSLVAGTYATESCPKICSKIYNQCRSTTDSNKATCASGYSSCLGYFPFAQNGTLITPTACSKTAKIPAWPTKGRGFRPSGVSNHTRPIPTGHYTNVTMPARTKTKTKNKTKTKKTKTKTKTKTPKTKTKSKTPKSSKVSKVRATSVPAKATPDVAVAVAAKAKYSFSNTTTTATTSASRATRTKATAKSTTLKTSKVSKTTKYAASTGTSTPFQKEADDVQVYWTVKNLNRECNASTGQCFYTFGIASSNNATTHCSFLSSKSTSPSDSFFNAPCSPGSPYEIDWEVYNGTTAANTRALMNIANTDEETRAYFSIESINSRSGKTYGSGAYGDVGPSSVWSYNTSDDDDE